MTEYDNTDRGVLFKNDRKNSASQPDYKGSLDVGGEQFWISAWIKESQKGKFMSLSITLKEQQAPAPAAAPRPAANLADMDDDIPF